MSWITKLFKKEAPEATSSPFKGGFDSLLRGQRAIQRELIITEIPYVVACVEKRANLTSSIQFDIYDNNNQIIEDHPLSHLLKKANKVFNHSFRDLVYLIQTRLDYFGNAFIWCRKSTNGRDIIDLIPIMTNLFKIIPSGDKYNAFYEFKISGQTIKIPGEEIIHFRTLGIAKDDSFINNHIVGTPIIINSLKPILTAHKEMIEYIQSYFENDTIPPMIYKNPDGISEDQYERLRENYNSAFGTSSKKPKLLLAEGNGEFFPMDVNKNSFNPSVFKEGLDNNITEQICTAFKTPKALLTNEFKYSDRNQYLQTYKQDVIKPLADYIAETFTNHFNKYYSEITLKSDEVSYVNENLKLQYVTLLSNNNAITTNELREAAGYEPLDEPIITNEENLKKKTLDNVEIADEKILFKYWKKYDDISESYKDVLQDTVKEFYDELKQHIVSNLENKSKKNYKDEINSNTIIIDLELMLRNFIEKINPDLIDYLDEIILLATNDINIDPEDFTKGELFIQQVTKEINNLMKDPIETVDKEIKNQITKIINDNPLDTAEERLNKIITMIDDRFETVYKGSRSETIARTTATASSESMKNKVFTDSGFDKVWVSSRDGKVRDSHNKADRQIANNGLFEIAGKKAKHPSDSSLPAKESINCRCRIAAKKKEKLYINGKVYLS